MPKIYETSNHHISNIRDALIIKFIELDNSKENSGDARLRLRHLATIREFCPADLRSTPYGIDGAFFSSIEEERIGSGVHYLQTPLAVRLPSLR